MMHSYVNQLAAAAQRDDMLHKAARHRLKVGLRPARTIRWQLLITGRKKRTNADPVIDLAAHQAALCSRCGPVNEPSPASHL
jgi:hypothetical protein